MKTGREYTEEENYANLQGYIQALVDVTQNVKKINSGLFCYGMNNQEDKRVFYIRHVTNNEIVFKIDVKLREDNNDNTQQEGE